MIDFDCTIHDETRACPDRKLIKNTMGKPTYFKLRDADGFSAELAKQGLALDWIAYGDYTISTVEYERGMTSILKKDLKNFPIRNDSMVVPNPKDIVVPALKNLPGLRSDMETTAIEMMLHQWSTVSMTDPVQVYSVPVFVMIQGIDSMKQAKQAASDIKKAEEKEAEEKKKNLIMLIISLVLIVSWPKVIENTN